MADFADFDFEFSETVEVPTSAGKGGGKVNELLNVAADKLLAVGNKLADAVLKENPEGSKQIAGFPADLTAQQIAGKVNGMIAAENEQNPGTYPWYLVVRNRNRDGSDSMTEITVNKHGGETETKQVANALYLIPGEKPVRAKRDSDTEMIPEPVSA